MNYTSSRYKLSGQAMIAGMGLMAVTAAVIFMLFNSNRAVTEKINLVNAADATAYSGALVASRELNFMAYTNRTMIANEVAIGHMVSYQSEVSLVTNVFSGNITGVGPNIVLGLFNAALGLVGTDVAGVFQAWEQGMKVIAGTYIVSTDATNALYGNFQNEEYEALLGTGPKGSIVDEAMLQVAQAYVQNPDVQILVNDSSAIDALIASGSVDLEMASKLEQAKNSTKEFCYLVMFAAAGDPDAVAADEDSTNTALRSHCDGGALADGSYDQPLADTGVLLDLIKRSSENVSSSQWITDRNISYNPGFTAGMSVDRSGASEVVWGADGMNWQAQDHIESSNSLFNLIGGVDADGSSDAKSAASALTSVVPWAADAVATMLSAGGWCVDIDCSAVSNGEYNGIQRYAMINPLMNQATVRVALTQTGNCNDNIGRDDDTGQAIAKWHDDQTRYGTNCNSEPVTAYSAAQVFYQAPSVGFGPAPETEANLFNPFWQARLAP